MKKEKKTKTVQTIYRDTLVAQARWAGDGEPVDRHCFVGTERGGGRDERQH